jgi:Divergent InlB B-repeat domain
VPGLDPEIDEIILRALKTDPNKRYQDATTLQPALERYRLRLEPEPEAADAPAPRATPPPPGTRNKSREARAEAAYQRALASYQSGSRDAARRFAVEAIAEDPGHAGARALLSRLERRPPETPAAPARDVGPRAAAPPAIGAAPTMVSGPSAGNRTMASAPMAPGSTLASGSTVVAGTPLVSGSTVASGSTVVAGSTVVGGGTSAPDQTRVSGPPPASGRKTPSASAPTILYTPPAARAPFWKKYQSWFGGAGGSSAARARQQSAQREGASQKTQQPFWVRYQSAAPIVAIVLLILLIGGGALLVLSWFSPSGQLLTVTKPTGGTLVGPGIKCGTQGSDCATRASNGATIELTGQADAGYVFRGYIGDCAPGGLMIMKAGRTCGATFEPMEKQAPGVATQTLTISPVPSGGTLQGIDIMCGTTGSVCSANHPDGVPVELHPIADSGFTFMGFVGDCAPLGQTQMTGPRTCSATFTATDSLKQGKPLPPKIAGGQPTQQPPQQQPTTPGGERGRGTSPDSTRPNPANNPPPPVVLPPPVQPQVQPPQPPAEVKPPISDEDFAKNAVKTALKELCAAYEALDPDAAAQVFPKVNMAALKIQLNKSRYKSVQCTFAEPTFLALDPAAGTAKIKVDVKRVFEHTALSEKPEVFEYIATMALSRASQRGRWVFDTAEYRPKPKDK